MMETASSSLEISLMSLMTRDAFREERVSLREPEYTLELLLSYSAFVIKAESGLTLFKVSIILSSSLPKEDERKDERSELSTPSTR